MASIFIVVPKSFHDFLLTNLSSVIVIFPHRASLVCTGFYASLLYVNINCMFFIVMFLYEMREINDCMKSDCQ